MRKLRKSWCHWKSVRVRGRSGPSVRPEIRSFTTYRGMLDGSFQVQGLLASGLSSSSHRFNAEQGLRTSSAKHNLEGYSKNLPSAIEDKFTDLSAIALTKAVETLKQSKAHTFKAWEDMHAAFKTASDNGLSSAKSVRLLRICDNETKETYSNWRGRTTTRSAPSVTAWTPSRSAPRWTATSPASLSYQPFLRCSAK